MPLTLTELRSKGELDQQRRAFGIWVQDERKVQIRVFVTCETLQQLEPSQVPDLYGWSETFGNMRALIVRVASDKFDRNGADSDDQYEGQPVMTLRSMDF